MPRRPSRRSGKKTSSGPSRLRAWLTSPTALVMAAGLILPNLLSIATLGSLLDVSLPPRTISIMAYAMLAICARRIPFVLTVILFLGILAFDLIWTIAVSFGLAPSELVTALDHAQHVHVFQSPLYGALIGVLMATSSVTLWLLYRRETLLRANIVAMFAAALMFAGVDFVTNVSPHYQFGALLGRNVPIESAAAKSGFNGVVGTDGHNAVMVIVEGLGYLTDPAARREINSPLYDARITDKYRVTAGSVIYYGSTTSGEMRELCDTRQPYLEFSKANGTSCLPARLRMRGYTTMAVHAFHHSMFERDEWYPVIGFEKEVFGEKLMNMTHRLCGSAFRGVCDADLPPVIAQASRAQQEAEIHLLAHAQHAYPGRARRGADEFWLPKGCRHIPAHTRLCDGRALARRV